MKKDNKIIIFLNRRAFFWEMLQDIKFLMIYFTNVKIEKNIKSFIDNDIYKALC